MALQNCLNPPAVVAAFAELIDLDSYYASAPDQAAAPYVLIGYAPNATTSEPTLDGVPQTWSDDLYATLVASTPGNVEVLREQIRQAVNPDGRGRVLPIEGRLVWIKRGTIATAVGPDRNSAKLAETNDYPMYAMDAYRVFES